MAYRNDSEALAERFESLTKQLDQLRAQAQALTAEEASLGRELDGVRARLDPAARRSLPLANVQIASPCDARWEDMQGDDRMRFCGDCKKHVHDLSKMNREQVDVFLHAHAEGACVRLYQRADGTLITADCPVGLRRRRARALLVATMSVGACAMLGFSALGSVVATRALEPCHVASEPAALATTTVVPRVPMVLAASSSPEPARPSPQGLGFIWVDAPEGSRIYEGDRFLGTAPLQFAAPAGIHSLRAIHPRTKRSRSAVAVVWDRQVSTAHLQPDPPRPPIDEHPMTMGKIELKGGNTF